LVEEDEKVDAMTDSECVPDDEKMLDEEEIFELKDEEVKEEDGEINWKDPSGEKEIIKAILAKREKKEGDDEKKKNEENREGETEDDGFDDGESSVITDFEFQVRIFIEGNKIYKFIKC